MYFLEYYYETSLTDLPELLAHQMFLQTQSGWVHHRRILRWMQIVRFRQTHHASQIYKPTGCLLRVLRLEILHIVFVRDSVKDRLEVPIRAVAVAFHARPDKFQAAGDQLASEDPVLRSKGRLDTEMVVEQRDILIPTMRIHAELDESGRLCPEINRNVVNIDFLNAT